MDRQGRRDEQLAHSPFGVLARDDGSSLMLLLAHCCPM